MNNFIGGERPSENEGFKPIRFSYISISSTKLISGNSSQFFDDKSLLTTD